MYIYTYIHKYIYEYKCIYVYGDAYLDSWSGVGSVDVQIHFVHPDEGERGGIGDLKQKKESERNWLTRVKEKQVTHIRSRNQG